LTARNKLLRACTNAIFFKYTNLYGLPGVPSGTPGGKLYI